MALKNITSQQKAILKNRARSGDLVAREAINSIDNEISLNGTTAPITLYVESTGKNTNPGTQALPFLTVQAALDSVPKRLRHLVTIKIGIGTFAGFSVQGFTVDPADGTAVCGLDIQGTLITATATTGTASGTATSGVATNITTDVMSQLVDAGQTWTINEHKGKLLEVTAGTGSSASLLYPIVSNTATALTTVVGTFDSTSVYVIRTWGTVINTTVPSAQSIPRVGANPFAGPTSVVNFSGNLTARNAADFALQRLKLAPSGSPTYLVQCSGGNAALGISHCNGTTTSFGPTQFAFINSGPSFISRCVLSASGSFTSGVYIDGPITTSQVNFSAFFFAGGTCIAVPNGIFIANTNYMENATVGVDLTGSRSSGLSFGGNWILACGTGIKANGGGESGSAQLSPLSNNIRNCTTAGIVLQGPVAMIAGGGGANNFYGSGNLVGLVMSRGARANLGPGYTLAGTTEITLDGVSTTVATMRAASPTLITNTFGTIIYN